MKILVALKEINRAEVYRRTYEDSPLGLGRLGLTGLAALVALLGLSANSAGIFIPALFFAALMGPMMGSALGLALQDWKLAGESAKSFGRGVAVIFVVATVGAWLSPLREATPEMVARTTPNLIDLMVALLAGTATVWIRCTQSEKADFLPQALVSAVTLLPLCVAGYGVGTGQWDVAWGAGKLFLVNSVGIILAADLGFILFGFHSRREDAERRVLSRVQIVFGFVLLVVLATPLLGTLRRVILQRHTRAEIQDLLGPLLTSEGASLAELQYREASDALEITPVIRTPQYLSQTDLETIKQKLQTRLGRPVRLNFKQVLQLEMGDAVTGGVVRQEEPDYRRNVGLAIRDLHGTSQAAVTSAMANLPFAQAETIDVGILGPEQPLQIRLRLSSSDKLSTDAVKILTSMVSQNLGMPVVVEGKTRLTDEAFAGIVNLGAPSPALNRETRKCLRYLGDLLQNDRDLSAELTLSGKSPEQLAGMPGEIQKYLNPRFQIGFNQLSVRVDPSPKAAETALAAEMSWQIWARF